VTVHDHPDTPSAISLKRASTIAEIRTLIIEWMVAPSGWARCAMLVP
jgi:hypothetical protein